nr:cell adhesion regulator [Homo sapiens]prf//1808302A cell adhesion regulator [Homo sapiens]
MGKVISASRVSMEHFEFQGYRQSFPVWLRPPRGSRAFRLQTDPCSCRCLHDRPSSCGSLGMLRGSDMKGPCEPIVLSPAALSSSSLINGPVRPRHWAPEDSPLPPAAMWTWCKLRTSCWSSHACSVGDALVFTALRIVEILY